MMFPLKSMKLLGKLHKNNIFNKHLAQSSLKYFSIETTNEENEKKGGFAQAYLKQQEELRPKLPEISDESFATLLRNSAFIDLGDPTGKIVYGKIFHIVGNDLYIDFGWKFHTVCVRPAKNGENYVRGATVRLRIRDLELSSKFLGSDREITLCEADCTLLGLVQIPVKN